MAYYRKGQWDKANADFAKAIELNPNNPIYWNNRGDTFGHLGQWGKAISDFSKAIQLNPGLEFAWGLRGSAHAALGQWEKASGDLVKAGSFPKFIPGAWLDLALVRLQLGDAQGYRQACARFREKWTEKDDPRLVAWVSSAAPNPDIDLGPLVQALLQRAKAANPDYLTLRALGAALYRSGKATEAIKELQRAADLRKEPSPSVWILMAMAHHQLGQDDDAQKWLLIAKNALEDAANEASATGPKEAVSRKNLPWSERVAVESLFREAAEALKDSGLGPLKLKTQLGPPQAGLLDVLMDHRANVTCVVYSPNAQFGLSGGFDHKLWRWDLQTGKSQPLLGHRDVVWCVAISADGKKALSGSQDKTVRVWDLQTGGQLHLLEGHQGVVSSVAFSPDGSQGYSGNWDGSVRVWDMANGQLLRVLSPKTPVLSMALAPGGNKLLLGSNDGSLRLVGS